MPLNMKAWGARRNMLVAEQKAAQLSFTGSSVLHADLGRMYRRKVARLTKVFERIRALIEAVVLTPEDGKLSIHLRGELASMLELCACKKCKKPPR